MKRIACLALALGVATLSAQPAPAPAAHHELDFWLGEWEVFADGKLDGTNRIERMLDGAAIIEHWRDVEGHEGKSWFYFHRPENRWKQVWVTDTGAVKEKVLDRTTLTPLPDGTVRQLIEQSTDGGATWKVGFDAIYRRKKSG